MREHHSPKFNNAGLGPALAASSPAAHLDSLLNAVHPTFGLKPLSTMSDEEEDFEQDDQYDEQDDHRSDDDNDGTEDQEVRDDESNDTEGDRPQSPWGPKSPRSSPPPTLHSVDSFGRRLRLRLLPRDSRGGR